MFFTSIIEYWSRCIYQKKSNRSQIPKTGIPQSSGLEKSGHSQKSRCTSSIRGNLVRTFNYSIEDDFIVHIDKELGKGGVGVVYVGERRDNQHKYAVKYVNKVAYEREVIRLERELKLLKDVDHANIVRVFSVYNEPTKIFFVMELCSGGHLG